MHPLITVAVPTCNGARHLRAALSSILRSTSPYNLMIVDDRSDDETLAIAREIVGDRARIEVNPERLGLANNWNRCVALSQTPLVAIFHQDDVMFPGHIQAHLEAYSANLWFGWVASGAEVIDDLGQSVPGSVVERGVMAGVDRDYASGEAVEALAIGNPLRCSGVTLNASAHAKVGGFDPSFRYVVDWDYWLRVAHVRPVAWRVAPSVAIRWHPASETHRFSGGTVDLDETARLLDRIDPLVGPAQRSKGNRRLARAFLNRAYVAFQQGDSPLARLALVNSFRLAPGQLAKNLLSDPRLLAQMGMAVLAPGRSKASEPNGGSSRR